MEMDNIICKIRQPTEFAIKLINRGSVTIWEGWDEEGDERQFGR